MTAESSVLHVTFLVEAERGPGRQVGHMPATAPDERKALMESMGATVEKVPGERLLAAVAECMAAEQRILVHPFDDVDIIRGGRHVDCGMAGACCRCGVAASFRRARGCRGHAAVLRARVGPDAARAIVGPCVERARRLELRLPRAHAHAHPINMVCPCITHYIHPGVGNANMHSTKTYSNIITIITTQLLINSDNNWYYL